MTTSGHNETLDRFVVNVQHAMHGLPYEVSQHDPWTIEVDAHGRATVTCSDESLLHYCCVTLNTAGCSAFRSSQDPTKMTVLPGISL